MRWARDKALYNLVVPNLLMELCWKNVHRQHETSVINFIHDDRLLFSVEQKQRIEAAKSDEKAEHSS